MPSVDAFLVEKHETGGMTGTTGVLTDGPGSHIEDFPGNIRG